MSSLHAIYFLGTAAKFARSEHETVPKSDIVKKLQDIKYLSSQKKVPKLSLRKEIIHLESQLQGVLELEERFARHKDNESVTIASLKQQISLLKNKLRAVNDMELDKKMDHLSFLLGEHLARQEMEGEVQMAESTESAASKANLDIAKKAAMLQKRLQALKEELQLNRELETKKPQEVKLLEAKIELFEQKLHDYLEQHSGAVIQHVATIETPSEESNPYAQDIEVKHKMLFPQFNVQEEKESNLDESTMMEIRRQVPLPPPPRLQKRN